MRHIRSGQSFKPKLLALSVAACFSAQYTAQVLANPTGATVVSGSASFATSGNTLTINNSTNAIINWQSFSINSNEITKFLQSSAGSAVLNRVVGSGGVIPQSIINGILSSNGHVFLLNPSGVIIGATARIDVAGMVTSSLNLSNEDFLNGRLRFTDLPNAGSVINQGNITAAPGGRVFLVGSSVENSGIIHAPDGQIVLAAGKSVELASENTPFVTVKVTADNEQALNLGSLVSQGGRVNMHGVLVKQAGVIEAGGAVVGANGEIRLVATRDLTLTAGSKTTANGAAGGKVTLQAETGTNLIRGAVEATGSSAKGGTISALGVRVGVVGSGVIDASGETGGGTVLVGGDYQGKNADVQNAERTLVGADGIIRADAKNTGDGGRVIVWADGDTQFGGTISVKGGANGGNGGFVETSGKQYLGVQGTVDISAPRGQGGTWLLDPENITITDDGIDSLNHFSYSSYYGIEFGVGPNPGTSDISVSTINNTLSYGTVQLQAENDITLNTNLDLSNSGDLIARAGNNIDLGGNSISLHGNLTLSANDSLATTPSGTGKILGTGSNITTDGGSVTLSGVAVTIGNINTSQINGGGAITITAEGGNGTYPNSITTGELNAAGGAFGNGGNVTLIANVNSSSGGDVTVNGNILTHGGDGATASQDYYGGTGGGSVTLKRNNLLWAGSITVNGNIDTSGGNGETSYGGYYGGSGGYGGTIFIGGDNSNSQAAGNVTVVGNISVYGGNAGAVGNATRGADAPTGGHGGGIQIIASDTVLVSGALNASGGRGGDGAPGGSAYPTDGGNGGQGGDIDLFGSTRNAVYGSIMSSGGAGGNGGNGSLGYGGGDGGAGGNGGTVKLGIWNIDSTLTQTAWTNVTGEINTRGGNGGNGGDYGGRGGSNGTFDFVIRDESYNWVNSFTETHGAGGNVYAYGNTISIGSIDSSGGAGGYAGNNAGNSSQPNALSQGAGGSGGNAGNVGIGSIYLGSSTASISIGNITAYGGDARAGGTSIDLDSYYGGAGGSSTAEYTINPYDGYNHAEVDGFSGKGGSVSIEALSTAPVSLGQISTFGGAGGDGGASGGHGGWGGSAGQVFITGGTITVAGGIYANGGRGGNGQNGGGIYAGRGGDGGEGGHGAAVYVSTTGNASGTINVQGNIDVSGGRGGSGGATNVDTLGIGGVGGEAGSAGSEYVYDIGDSAGVYLTAGASVSTMGVYAYGGEGGGGGAGYYGGRGEDGGYAARIWLESPSVIANGPLSANGGNGGTGGDALAVGGYNSPGSGGHGQIGSNIRIVGGSSGSINFNFYGSVSASGGNGAAAGVSGAYPGSYGDGGEGGIIQVEGGAISASYVDFNSIGGSGRYAGDGGTIDISVSGAVSMGNINAYGGSSIDGVSENGRGGYVDVSGASVQAGNINSTGGGRYVHISATTGDALVGDINTSTFRPTYNGSSNRGGDVKIMAAGRIEVGGINTRGADGIDIGYRYYYGGSSGGNIDLVRTGVGTIYGGLPAVKITGDMITRGGDAYGQIDMNAYYGQGGLGGGINIASTASTGSGSGWEGSANAVYGSVVFQGSLIDTSGGNGSSMLTGFDAATGAAGADAGGVNVRATGNITLGAASIVARGGDGGDGRSAVYFTAGNGGGGGMGGAITMTGAAISAGSIDASGGNGGTGGSTSSSYYGANIGGGGGWGGEIVLDGSSISFNSITANGGTGGNGGSGSLAYGGGANGDPGGIAGTIDITTSDALQGLTLNSISAVGGMGGQAGAYGGSAGMGGGASYVTINAAGTVDVAGAINVKGGRDGTNTYTAGGGYLTVISHGNVSQAAVYGAIDTSSLNVLVYGAGNVDLMNTDNIINGISVYGGTPGTPVQGNINVFTGSNSAYVGTVAATGTVGITTSGAEIFVNTVAADGDVLLKNTATYGAITISDTWSYGGSVTVVADDLVEIMDESIHASTHFQYTSANDQAIEIEAGAFDNIHAPKVIIGSMAYMPTAGITINGSIDGTALGINTLSLQAGGAITQNSGSITVANLSAYGGGNISIDSSTNNLTNLQAHSVYGGGGNIMVSSATSLNLANGIDAAITVPGVSIASGSVSLFSGGSIGSNITGGDAVSSSTIMLNSGGSIGAALTPLKVSAATIAATAASGIALETNTSNAGATLFTTLSSTTGDINLKAHVAGDNATLGNVYAYGGAVNMSSNGIILGYGGGVVNASTLFNWAPEDLAEELTIDAGIGLVHAPMISIGKPGMTGNITLSGPIDLTSSASTLSLTTGGQITNTGLLTVSNYTANGGSVTQSAGINVNHLTANASAGDVTLTNAGNRVAYIDSGTANGSFALATATQLNPTATSVHASGGDVSLTNSYAYGGGSWVLGNVISHSGAVNIVADNISYYYGSNIAAPTSFNWQTATNAAIGVNQAFFAPIDAPVVKLGSTGQSAPVVIAGAVDLSATPIQTLSLYSAGDVYQSAGATLKVANLSAVGTNVLFTETNTVQNFQGRATAGDLGLVTSGNLALGAFDAANATPGASATGTALITATGNISSGIAGDYAIRGADVDILSGGSIGSLGSSLGVKAVNLDVVSGTGGYITTNQFDPAMVTINILVNAGIGHIVLNAYGGATTTTLVDNPGGDVLLNTFSPLNILGGINAGGNIVLTTSGASNNNMQLNGTFTYGGTTFTTTAGAGGTTIPGTGYTVVALAPAVVTTPPPEQILESLIRTDSATTQAVNSSTTETQKSSTNPSGTGGTPGNEKEEEDKNKKGTKVGVAVCN